MVSLLDVYEKVLSKIADDDKAKARGARVRSRVRWAEEGEASTRFYLRLEKQCGAKGWITAMHQPDGALATDIASICLSWVQFYSDLFSACTADMPVQDTLVSSLSSCLTEEESNLVKASLVYPRLLKLWMRWLIQRRLVRTVFPKNFTKHSGIS